MNEVLEFLKKAGVYFLATVDGGAPKVRPFGTALLFENKLYFQTGKAKPVSRQLAANPRVAISAVDGDRWLRIEATAVNDDRVAVKKAMLDTHPELRALYDENDASTQVLFLRDATATIQSFSGENKTVRF
ncbi:MAG: pyridoxamine 5'-phosphate oxidase family protein [Opitutaceae bacterium]|jgi:uncharacterized pyridoxamine 5'-phosphate oxidase family protein|nr:pyridoxamine 5'-phosphate oxidase family protein [Opitutaceae bacterium]